MSLRHVGEGGECDVVEPVVSRGPPQPMLEHFEDASKAAPAAREKAHTRQQVALRCGRDFVLREPASVSARVVTTSQPGTRITELALVIHQRSTRPQEL
eukprot:IDg1290t1